jgi:2-polyprenyl-6-methoxyphenol hydroxylase-like FAD-dependent oxidoreductase
MKQREPRHDITILERNASGSTYGWGVTFWENIMETLHRNDPESARIISDSTTRWRRLLVDVQGKQPVQTEAHGYSINRQRLLDTLTERAMNLGVRVEFQRSVMSLSELPDSDLIVACDGVNSRLRELDSARFATDIHIGRNKYVWLGTDKVLDAFTFAFVQTDFGWIWCYAYGTDGDSSTFIAECPREVWTGLGFDHMPADNSLATLEKLFADQLDGSRLTGKFRSGANLPWLSFKSLTNGHWHVGKTVLMGDAAHTTHFSLGFGTELAMKDAAALADKIQRHADLHIALEAYEKERKIALRQPQCEARLSARWFESISRYIGLEPDQFFALLLERRSPLLPRLPPLLYFKLHRATEEIAVLRELRKRVAPTAKALYSRRKVGQDQQATPR